MGGWELVIDGSLQWINEAGVVAMQSIYTHLNPDIIL